MQYVVERYLPGVTAGEYNTLRERVFSAARQVASEGAAIRYLGSTFIPEEESCFCRYESGSIDDVRRACELARVPFARISEAIDLTAPQSAQRQ